MTQSKASKPTETFILALDTSEQLGQLLLTHSKTQKTVHKIAWGSENKHSEVIAQKLSDLMALEKKTELFSLESIYVVAGPGSFTGLRVGINFAKTLAYSLEIPIYSINSLLALALSSSIEDGRLFSLIDAQKNSVFLSEFLVTDGHFKILEENIQTPASLLPERIPENSFIFGSGVERYKNLWEKKFLKTVSTQKTNIQLEKVLSYQFKHNVFKPIPWKDLQPNYFKKSAAEELKIEARQRS